MKVRQSFITSILEMSLIVNGKIITSHKYSIFEMVIPSSGAEAGATGPKTPIEPDGPEDQASISLKHKTKSCSIEKFRKYN